MTAAKHKLNLGGFKLRTLLTVTQAINNNAPREELIGFFPKFLGDTLGIGKILLYTRQEDKWIPEVIYNLNLNEVLIEPEKHLLPYDSIQLFRGDNTPEYFSKFDLLIPVLHKQKPLAFLLLGDLDEERIEVSPLIKHYTFIQILANIIMVAIENKKLYKASLAQATLNKEMELASAVQQMLFPASLPANDVLTCAVHYSPHRFIGGDYYDVIQESEKCYVFCVADVSGKGIAASLIMSNFQAALRALLPFVSSLGELVHALNKTVFSTTSGEKFVTLFLARYNAHNHSLEYINAGHIPPLYFTSENGKIEFLEDGCIMLGALPEIPELQIGRVQVTPGATLFAYTDGLLELENEADESYGMEKLCLAFAKYTDLPVTELVEQIFAEAELFRGVSSYNDDLTLFACRF